MIFAELQYEQDYSDFHDELTEYLKSFFSEIESGLQGDSWIWIHQGADKVEIDTFSAMKHQIKSDTPNNRLLNKVIKLLSAKYKVIVFEQPEPHEE